VAYSQVKKEKTVVHLIRFKTVENG